MFEYSHGGLGQGHTRIGIGRRPEDMGDNLTAVDLNGAAIAVELGANHACVILEGGLLKCFGLGM